MILPTAISEAVNCLVMATASNVCAKDGTHSIHLDQAGPVDSKKEVASPEIHPLNLPR